MAGRGAVVVSLLILSILGVQAFHYNYCFAPETRTRDVQRATHAKFRAQGLTLAKVLMTFRHGDRTPLGRLPTTFKDNDVWNCSLNSLQIFSDDTDGSAKAPRLYRKLYLPGREIIPGDCLYGQLTDVGLRQHLHLGGVVREMYVDTGFLSPIFNTSDFWIRSTDVPRVLQSCQAMLLGLYPSSSSPQPLPVVEMHTMDNSLENMTPNDKLCPMLTKIYAAMMAGPVYQQHLNETLPLRQQLQQVFGTDNANFNMIDIADNFHARVCHNHTLPPGSEPLLAQIFAAGAFELSFTYTTFDALSLGIGSFIEEQLLQLDAGTNGIGPKMILYSGHDTSLWPMSYAYGFGDATQWPPYASHMFHELWKDSNGNYFINIIYNGDVMPIVGCTRPPCSYSKWRQMISPIVPPDFSKECSVVTSSLNEKRRSDVDRLDGLSGADLERIAVDVARLFLRS